MKLIYSHDPMCSWCWAFKPALKHLREHLPSSISFTKLLGGLAKDSDEPMPEQTQQAIQNHWRTIQSKVPGTEFNFEFWQQCKPRRSTYPACRAVIAARAQGKQFDDNMTLAIQQAYYLKARNPSDTTTLIKLADEIGLNQQQFEQDFNSNETNLTLKNEIQRCQLFGINSYPSLALKTTSTQYLISVDYNDPSNMLSDINQYINSIQP